MVNNNAGFLANKNVGILANNDVALYRTGRYLMLIAMTVLVQTPLTQRYHEFIHILIDKLVSIWIKYWQRILLPVLYYWDLDFKRRTAKYRVSL